MVQKIEVDKYLGQFNVQLPEDLLPEEIFNNTDLYWEIGFNEELEAGDIFLFGKDEDDPSNFHCALYLETDDHGSLLLHSSSVGDTAVWRLQDFIAHPSYEKIKGVRRFRKKGTKLHGPIY